MGGDGRGGRIANDEADRWLYSRSGVMDRGLGGQVDACLVRKAVTSNVRQVKTEDK